MMFETAENRVLEWRTTVAVCQNGAKKWILTVCARLFGGFSGMVCSTCWNYLETEMKLRYCED